MKIKISIVIPTYNRAFIIDKSLSYVINQNYENLEVIISDNCSQDNTYEVISKYLKDSRVKYFKNEINLGLIGNYNKALLEYATGDFIMFVPDDDILLNFDYVSRAVMYINRYSLSWIAAGSYLINIKEKLYKESVNKEFKVFSNESFFQFHKWGCDNFTGLTILFDRRKAIKLGGFNTNLYNFDLELMFKLAVGNNVAIMNSIEAFYAITDNQSNHLIDPNHMFMGYKLYENIKKFSNNNTLDGILNNNIKNYISACFKYFMDRDAFGEITFDNEYWMKYFKEISLGIYFPFFDDDTQKRYEYFKRDKNLFFKNRNITINNLWMRAESLEMQDFIKNFDDR